ncbi:hypothetical protein [Candidatus Thalassarchaeum betae]|uniref:hypothetical protein n=1 Tax=Candidatus Thalassarchaeum betae TaxID=2599289 RepID=UPI0030C71353|nr:hypothetical protein [Candidatus Thalassoarchaea betae]
MDKDLKIGFVLIGCALLLFPMTMDLMQEHDDAVREHQRECDMGYRLLVLNTVQSPDPVLCGELKGEKARKTTNFLGSLGLFVVTGVGGLVMVLPYETRDPKQPPPGRELR